MRIGILFSLLCAILSFSQPASGQELHLNWQQGDRWVVETTPRMSTMSSSISSNNKLKWSFEVVGLEKIREHECWHTSIRCIEANVQSPEIDIWVDKQNGMMVRTTSSLTYATHKAKLTETYLPSNGKATPVFGMIPALPLDMPVLSTAATNNTKSLEPQIYETMTGDGQTKDLGDLGFANMVAQNVQPVTSSVTKSLNTISSDNGFEVNIFANNRKVRQIWAPGKPWPVYSNNGVTESRLIEYIPAARSQEGSNE